METLLLFQLIPCAGRGLEKSRKRDFAKINLLGYD
jgi:hypothetical protein